MGPSADAARPARRPPHYHDGFFFRAALGPGWLRANNASPDDERVFSGMTSSAQVAFGGTLENLVALGGAYLHDEVWGLHVEDELVDGDEPDLDGYHMRMRTLGVFLDFYFGPKSGTHLQAFGGIGTLDVERPSSSSIDDPTGVVVNLGLGHEWWYSDSGLLGVLLALNYGNLQVDEGQGETSVRTLLPQILMTLTHN